MKRTVILAPGRMHGPHAPHLFYVGSVAAEGGAHVAPVHWPAYPDPEPLDKGAVQRLTTALASEMRRRQGEEVLVAARSLGSVVCPYVAARQRPAILMSPILTWHIGVNPVPVRRAIASSACPWLIIGGSEDPLWDSDFARHSGHQVVELAGADHAWRVNGGIRASLAATADALEAVEDYLRTVWPL